MTKRKPRSALLANIPIIDKGIPVPTKESYFSFMDKMKAGDSFLISDKTFNVGSASNSARFYAKNNGMEIIVRTVEGGMRVWRVS